MTHRDSDALARAPPPFDHTRQGSGPSRAPQRVDTKRVLALVAGTAILVAGQASAAVSSTAVVSKTYRNCTALTKVYPRGVGRVRARDKTSGTPVTNFKRSNKPYRENRARDRDKDGIACEKR